MKKSLPEKKRQRGSPEKFYLDADAKSALGMLSVRHSMPLSNVVCALLRAAIGESPRRGEDVIYAHLKKVFGREQFISFLKGVQAALPLESTPIIPPTANGDGSTRDYQPDMWEISKTNTIVLAYFAPSEENFGTMLSRMLTEKLKHKAGCVIAACTDTSSIPRGQREELSNIGIAFVALGDLRQLLENSMKKPARKKTPANKIKTPNSGGSVFSARENKGTVNQGHIQYLKTKP